MMEINTMLFILPGILIIVLAPLFAFVGSCIADMKGRSMAAWLIGCGLFFPMLILLCLLPQRKSPEFDSERGFSIIRGLGIEPLFNLVPTL
jgi:hypothetical protein